MKIGIIGSGNIGGNIGSHWAQAHHEVLFSSRHPEQLSNLIDRSGPHAKAGSVSDAAAFGEVILLATPFTQREAVIAEVGHKLVGKIIIDATNPYKPNFQGLALGEHETAVETLAALLPKSKVVKAFNHLPAAIAEVHSYAENERIGAYYAGDDKKAKAIVAQLVADAGFHPIDAGSLSDVWNFEPRGPLYNKPSVYTQAQEMLDDHVNNQTKRSNA